MKRIIFVTVVALLFCACGTSGPSAKKAKYPNSTTPEMQIQFNAADELYRTRKFSEADQAFDKFIAGYPYTELTDEARFRRGEIAFIKKDYQTAIVFYRQSVSEIVSPSIAPKAEFKTALALYRLNRSGEALDEIKKINRKDASAVLRLRADSLAVKASKAQKLASKETIVWYLWLLDDYADSQGVKATGISADELASENESLDEVRKWVSDSAITQADVESLPLKEMKGKRSGGYAAYKEALILHTQGDTKAATRALKSYVSTYPKHEYYGQARLLMGELGGEVGDAAGVKVGVILPLSGKYSEFGRQVLRGIECAVGVYLPCAGPAGMKLVIRDSETIAGGAASAVDELAAEDVIAIVGALASSSSFDIAKRAQELEIPIVTLTQREGVTVLGDFVFRSSISDASEMSTLAEHVVKKMGIKNISIIYPPSKKGMEYKQLFTDSVKAQGGNIISSQPFSPHGPMTAVDELRGRGAVENKLGDEGVNADEALMSLERHDVIFIPDSLSVATYLAQKFALDSNDKILLLGISRWDDQKLVDRAGKYVEGAVFVDAFYKQAPEEHVSAFVTRYKGAYDIDASILEALGYDATRLVINAVQEKGAAKRESVKNALARTSGFPGVTGKITFDDRREAKRELWVLTVRNGSIQQVK